MRAAVWLGVVAVLTAGGTAAAQDKKPDVLAKLEGHRGGIPGLAFSPRPSPKVAMFATGAGNGVIRLWDANTGKFNGLLDSQKHNGAKINHIGFSADGFVMSSVQEPVVAWNFRPRPRRILSRRIPRRIPSPDPKKDPEPKTAPETTDGVPGPGSIILIVSRTTSAPTR